jgi:hypothetical protein
MQHTHGKKLCAFTGTKPLISSQQLCCLSNGYHLLMPRTLCNVV